MGLGKTLVVLSLIASNRPGRPVPAEILPPPPALPPPQQDEVIVIDSDDEGARQESGLA